jgi:hypothetical protein
MHLHDFVANACSLFSQSAAQGALRAIQPGDNVSHLGKHRAYKGRMAALGANRKRRGRCRKGPLSVREAETEIPGQRIPVFAPRRARYCRYAIIAPRSESESALSLKPGICCAGQ